MVMEFDYTKEPIANLWNLARTFDIDINKIYKRYHAEADTDTLYVILRDNVTDSTRVVGDGKGLLRNSVCDIMLVSKSTGLDDKTDPFSINRAKIETALKNSGIVYLGVNLGYNGTYSQYTWEVNIPHV